MENKCNFCGNDLIFVKYPFSNGVINIRKQCKKCGLLLTYNYKKSLFNLDELPFYDKSKRNNFKNIKKSLKGNCYNVYLKSEQWKTKRNNVLERDNLKCRCCNSTATEVHHINYNTIQQEDYNVLISVCRNCHEKIHNKGSVYFKGLKANFNILKYCHSCKEYHNGKIDFCNNCKNKSYAATT